MQEKNRRNKANISKEEKEHIEELKKRAREARDELDEARGNTSGGRAVSVVVFLLSVVVLLGMFIGMVKLDVGGVASNLLAPAVGNVPVLRSILPSDMQKKSASEIAKEEAAAQAQADAAAQAASEQASSEAAAQAASEQAASEQAASEQAASEQAASEQAASEQAASEQAASEAAAAAEAALQDYVNTYSAMKPQDAAKVFDSMMPGEKDLIAKILEKLKPAQRAGILAKMNVQNAADLTTLMDKNVEQK